MSPDWLIGARRDAEQPPRSARDALHVSGPGGEAIAIGSIEPALGKRLVAAGLPISRAASDFAAAAWLVHGSPAAGLDGAFDAIADWLLAQGVSPRRRDERLAVRAIRREPARADAPDAADEVLATIERGVVRALGIATTAVHLVGSVSSGAIWVQQRAFDKATDPGRWDTLMGGQVAAGETIAETLARETMEEAGLAIDALLDLQQVEPVVVRRPVAEGYMVERVEVYTARLADDVRPVNRDGEVVAFARLERGALFERLAAGAFTLEATLILGQFLDPERR